MTPLEHLQMALRDIDVLTLAAETANDRLRAATLGVTADWDRLNDYHNQRRTLGALRRSLIAFYELATGERFNDEVPF